MHHRSWASVLLISFPSPSWSHLKSHPDGDTPVARRPSLPSMHGDYPWAIRADPPRITSRQESCRPMTTFARHHQPSTSCRFLRRGERHGCGANRLARRTAQGGRPYLSHSTLQKPAKPESLRSLRHRRDLYRLSTSVGRWVVENRQERDDVGGRTAPNERLQWRCSCFPLSHPSCISCLLFCQADKYSIWWSDAIEIEI